jgi:hypothetical protein
MFCGEHHMKSLIFTYYSRWIRTHPIFTRFVVRSASFTLLALIVMLLLPARPAHLDHTPDAGDALFLMAITIMCSFIAHLT